MILSVINMIRAISLLILIICSSNSWSDNTLDKSMADTLYINKNIEALSNIRHSLDNMLAYIKSRPDLFYQKKSHSKRFTSREQRLEIWNLWQSYIDRSAVLDIIGQQLESSYKNASGESRKTFFRLSFAAFLMQYRYTLDLINILENDNAMHTTLNEPVPESGLTRDSYKRIKFRFLNVLRASEFVRLNTIYQFYGQDKNLATTTHIKSDIEALWKLGIGKGTGETLNNALQIIMDTGFTVWFPVQKVVSEWMGDVKVFRLSQSLISQQQVNEIESLLEPGDILLERREWYLSNIGLPGYWPHAALYIGTEQQRKTYFNEPGVRQHFKTLGGFEAALKQNTHAYALGQKKDHFGHLPRVIEAISEGVSFTSLEHSVDADSVAILRPNLSKREKAIAIARAFQYSGRPYDFNFDFLTDSELVCTELVYKSYEPASGYTGLTLPSRKVMGRNVVTANDIAEMFDNEYNSDKAQLELIAFYDGHERARAAIKSDVETFLKSWKRPKMFIWVQGTAFEY